MTESGSMQKGEGDRLRQMTGQTRAGVSDEWGKRDESKWNGVAL